MITLSQSFCGKKKGNLCQVLNAVHDVVNAQYSLAMLLCSPNWMYSLEFDSRPLRPIRTFCDDENVLYLHLTYVSFEHLRCG